jgi:hypothetical protein
VTPEWLAAALASAGADQPADHPLIATGAGVTGRTGEKRTGISS